MPHSLILSAAADRPEYAAMPPYWLDRHPTGSLLILESMRGFPLEQFDTVYIAILKKHERQYAIRSLLEKNIRELALENKLRIVEIDQATKNQPETVARTIRSEGITGNFVVKDIDNFFDYSPIPGNSVAIFPLDGLRRVNPSDKSYVLLDDNQYIVNIIEKKIISRYFSAGAYAFEDAELFLRYYDRLEGYKPLYMSHLIYAMLLDRIPFRPVKVKNYVDWGTEDDWHAFKKQYCTLLVPLSAVLQDETAEAAVSSGTVLDHNRKVLSRVHDNGKARIILMTAQGEEMRELILQELDRANVCFDQLLCNVFTEYVQIRKSPLEFDLL